jgi:type II secretory pathway component PulF
MTLFLHRPERHRQIADRMEDCASLLDAGLGVRAAPARTDQPNAVQLAEDLRWLDAWERAALEAAERAGELPVALRQLATHHRTLAELGRGLWAGLRYPLLVGGLLLGLSLTLVPAAPALVYGIAILLVLAGATAGYARAQLRSPTGRPELVPIVGRLARLRGELAYLTALQHLYRAGVPLRDAHPAALRAVPLASLRRSLFGADAALQAGGPLTDALAGQRSLSPETLELLALGERTGTLSESLGRAADHAGRKLVAGYRSAARWVGAAAYALAVLAVAYTALSFYGGLYGRLVGAR